eukprot:Platyproteum_vivax@DN14583_c0_g1_i1.p1
MKRSVHLFLMKRATMMTLLSSMKPSLAPPLENIPKSVPFKLHEALRSDDDEFDIEEVTSELLYLFHEKRDFAFEVQSVTAREYCGFRLDLNKKSEEKENEGKEEADKVEMKKAKRRKEECVSLRSWLIFNSLADSVSLDDKFTSDTLAVQWHCLVCNETFWFNRKEIHMHRQTCIPKAAPIEEAS